MLPFRPDMVFFDYGGTLSVEGPVTTESAARSIAAYCDGAEQVTPEKLEEIGRLWEEITNMAWPKNAERKFSLEYPIMSMLRYVMDFAGLKSSLSPVEQELRFHQRNATHQPMPYISELLDELYRRGIPTGVISNNALSGDGLKAFLDQYLPNHHFEVILTSADYLCCKPCDRLFLAVCSRVGVDPKKCWYLGDSAIPDVSGGLSAGMFPIHICRKEEAEPRILDWEGSPYLRVNHWAQLIELMRSENI